MIKENVERIFGELPAGVELVAAAKTKTAEDILEAIDAGIRTIGENYIQEAEEVFKIVGAKCKWHFIGHLQRNKVKKAVEIFDMIETVDNFELAAEIGKRCAVINKTMPVLIEINSGREPNKSGIFPENAEELISQTAPLKNIKVSGLMTMGPVLENPQDIRPYFKETKLLFEKIKALNLQNVEMKYLSMGMTDSYKIAIEEGANVVRIGSAIFGRRN